MACCVLAALAVGLSLRVAFVAPGGAPNAPPVRTGAAPQLRDVPGGRAPEADGQEAWGAAARFLAGAVLGAVLLATSAGPARADVEDVAIPVDGKGKTTSLSKETLNRGKKLFNASCAICHVGGGTRTNQNVGLALEELNGAFPPRGSIEGLVDYLNNPTTYDGLRDISENHPSIRGQDVWPKMRSMKQQDLYDISGYIMYNTQTIPEKWDGGKQYY